MPFQPILSQVRKYNLCFDFNGTKIILLAEWGHVYENGDEDWRLSTKRDTFNVTWNKATSQLKLVFSSRPLPADFLETIKQEFVNQL
jgi:hypothetical protein